MRKLNRRAAHGAISLAQVILLAAFAVVLALAVWWFVDQSDGTSATQTAGSIGTAKPEPNPAAGPAVDDLSANDLYKAARAAMSDGRMVAPPGNNALEFYLRIVAKQPDDSGATDALRELFPFATGSAEDQINQGNFDEATRIMSLLAKADPSNYTLTILRSKLDAKKKQNDKDAQVQAQQVAAAARAAAAPATASSALSGAAAPAVPAPEPVPPPAAAPVARPAEIAKAAPIPAVAPPPSEPIGETRDVRILTPPQPSYPTAAVRNHQSGWVEVEFTVAADGSVQNAKVVSANPARLFDREAVSAIRAAKFEPRLDKGRAVATTMRRRIEFKLNN